MKGSEKMQLWLSESIYKSDKISIYGLAVYCSIKSMLPTEEIKELCISNEILIYQLTKSLDSSRRFATGIKTGYDELLDLNIVKKVDSKGKFDVIDCSNLFLVRDSEYFTIIEYDEILKIFQQKDVNTLSLLKYFIYLMGTISSTIDVYIDACQHKCRVVGNLTLEYLSQISGISTKSIVEYNKLLEKIGLLYIYRQNDFVINKSSGELSRMTNVYGRPIDKIYIDTYATNLQKYKSSYRYIEHNIEEVNKKRRLAQMYNQICKGNDSNYSEDDIKEVYTYIFQQNLKYESLYNKKNDSTYFEKIRDISVFEKYNFIIKEKK